MILIITVEPPERTMPALIAFFLLLLAVTVQGAQWPYSPLKTQTITTTALAAHPLDALLMEKLGSHGLSMNEMASRELACAGLFSIFWAPLPAGVRFWLWKTTTRWRVGTIC